VVGTFFVSSIILQTKHQLTSKAAGKSIFLRLSQVRPAIIANWHTNYHMQVGINGPPHSEACFILNSFLQQKPTEIQTQVASPALCYRATPLSHVIYCCAHTPLQLRTSTACIILTSSDVCVQSARVSVGINDLCFIEAFCCLVFNDVLYKSSNVIW